MPPEPPGDDPGMIDVEATASAAGDSGRAEPAGRGTVRADRADPEMSGQPARPETPALEQRNTVYGSGTVVSVQGGDLTFYQQEPDYLVVPFPFGVAARGEAARRQRPSELLNAKSEIIPFYGRTSVLAALARWRDDDASAAVLLVHAGAGQGKSRLAARFAELSAAQRWDVCAVRHRGDPLGQPGGTPFDRELVGRAGCLIVVDYADRWPLRHLQQLLLDRRLHAASPTRFLLLARSGGDWWRSLSAYADRSVGLRCTDLSLAPLAADPADRSEIFARARQRFAEVLGVPDAAAAAPDLDSGSSAQSVLSVHMAALATAFAAVDGRPVPSDPESLSAFLLDRELYHWSKMHENGRIQSRPSVIGRMVYAAVLTSATTYDRALEMLAVLRIAELPADAATLIDDHRLCYPPVDPGSVLEPLYPDRLAEDFLALRTPGHHVTSHPPDPWAAGALSRLLGAGTALPVNRPEQLTRCLGVLIEAAARWPHLADRELFPLVRKEPQVIFAAGGAALSALAVLPGVDLATLRAIDAAVPEEVDVDLCPGVAELARRLATAQLRSASDPDERAALYAKLGLSLIRTRYYREALRPLERAVELYREPGDVYRGPGDLHREAGDGPAERRIRLAVSLGRLGIVCHELGQWVAARRALSEALRIWATFEGTDGGRYDVDRVACWESLSIVLDRLGNPEKASAARHRATIVLRRLVATDSAHTGALAEALLEMGEQLHRRGLHSEALARLNEAMPMWRGLVGRSPMTYGPGYASLLLVRGRTWAAAGQLTSARDDVATAVALYRAVSGTSLYHDRALAGALVVLGQLWTADGQDRRAVPILDEAVRIERNLTRVGARRHHRLARTLHLFAGACAAAGVRLPAALDAVTEAGRIYRELTDGTEDQPMFDRLHQAQELGAEILDALGRPRQAERLRNLIRAARGMPTPPAAGAATPPFPGRPDSGYTDREIYAMVAESRWGQAARVLNAMDRSEAGRIVAAFGPFNAYNLVQHGLHSDLIGTARGINPVPFANYDDIARGSGNGFDGGGHPRRSGF